MAKTDAPNRMMKIIEVMTAVRRATSTKILRLQTSAQAGQQRCAHGTD